MLLNKFMPNKEEWFSNWFGSPYYPMLYKHRNEEEAAFFLTWLCESLALSPGAKVLDLACGRGRHSRFLNQLGFSVSGWDISGESIAEAKEWESEALRFAVQDMRTPFPEGNFDAVFNLFTSFGYFENTEENEKVLKHVKQSLLPDGKLVLDYLNPEYIIPRLIPYEEKTINNISFTIERFVLKEFIIKEITIIDNKNIHKFKEKVQLFTHSNFENLFSKIGMNLIDTFGDYKGNAFKQKDSPRIICIVSK